MAYYYLDRPFRSGQVLDYLLTAKFYKVVSMDIGHGESTAYIYEYVGGSWQCRQLRLNAMDTPTIPTYISYAGETVHIGYDADKLNFFQHFKEPPHKWSKPVRRALKDFIAQFWKELKRWNGELVQAEAAEEVLLVAGCPASREWLGSGDYRDLILEATGYAHTAVISEASAAVMHAVFREELDLRQGVAIYDLGSSTVDFVYLWMGKKMISRSLSLGGRDVDYAMLRKILADNRMTMRDVPRDQRQYLLAQIRSLKENYYPQKQLPERNVYLLKTDEAGRTILSARSVGEYDLPGIPDKVLKVKLDDGFMGEVLTEDTQLENHPGSSWHTVLKNFFHDTFLAIADRPCATVILSGGTSNIPEVCELAEQTYSGKAQRVFRSKEPSAAVAQGLCLARGRACQAMRRMQQMGQEENHTISSLDDIRDHIFRMGFNSWSSVGYDLDGKHAAILRKMSDKTIRTFLDKKQSPKISTFIAELDQNIRTEIDSEEKKDMIRTVFREDYSYSDYLKNIKMMSDSVAQSLYPDGKRNLIEQECLLAIRNERIAVQDYTDIYNTMRKYTGAGDITIERLVGENDAAISWFLMLFPALVLAVAPIPPETVNKLLPEYFREAEGDLSASAFDSKAEKAFGNYADRAFTLAQLPHAYVVEALIKADITLSKKRLKKMLEHSQTHYREAVHKAIHETVTDSFRSLVGDIFEIALGQLLFLVFEEPADI